MSSISQRQHHSINQEQTCTNIIRLIQQNELEDPNTFLVINGGTGVGKTHAIMTAVQEELCKKFNHKQTMLVVESRTAMVQQAETVYENQIFCIGNINVCQRIHFMNLIQHNQLIYDWIVIDECHGLFSEASFAEDAEFIANWIRCGRAQNTHIIFVTANDEYFDDLSKKFFPDSYNFIYLFPDFTQYVSNTYVKEIQFIKTNRFETVVNNFLHSHQSQKGIIFLKKASDVKDWFFRLLEENYNVGMIVSQANTTAIELTTKQAENLILDLSNGKIGLTMADLCTFYDVIRTKENKETIRDALKNEKLPEDIDILLATDTIQEGISIKSPINYILIEGYNEVEVRQKLGRFRGNLDLLYIIFNPTAEAQRLNFYTKTYELLLNWIKTNNQIALAEFYGIQTSMKMNFNFILKKKNEITNEIEFSLNEPAFLNYQYNLKNFLELKNNTKESVEKYFSYPLLNGNPKIISYDEIKNEEQNEKLNEILKKWKNIPLKGEAQNEILNDFIKANICNKNRIPINSFRAICIFLKDKIKEKQATKEDLKNFPQYLKKLREKYKILE